MATPTVTPATGAALRKVFQLLEDQFDVEEGSYRNDYSDEKVAKETSISVDAVKSYRTAAFGKLKPPTELYRITQDLKELETFALKMDQELKEQIKQLRVRVSAMQKKFD